MMYSVQECLLMFIYEDEILFEELPEGHRAYAALKIEYLKSLDLVTVTQVSGSAYPQLASLTTKASNLIAELRAR